MTFYSRYLAAFKALVNLKPTGKCAGLLLFSLLTAIISAFWACSKGRTETDPRQIAFMREYREYLQEQLGPEYDGLVPSATAEQLQRGEVLYQQLCMACHGVHGTGVIHGGNDITWRPADLTDPEQAAFLSDRGKLYVIKKGIPNTPMNGWDPILSDEDVMAVFQYTRSLVK
jgi:mono/diheme cytochrome c family protein